MTVWAQSDDALAPPLFRDAGVVTVTPVAPNISVYRDLDGNSATVYQNSPQQSFYSNTDKQGHVTQGWIYNNYATTPLEMPPPIPQMGRSDWREPRSR